MRKLKNNRQCQYVIICGFVFGIRRNVTTNVFVSVDGDHERAPPTPYRTLRVDNVP